MKWAKASSRNKYLYSSVPLIFSKHSDGVTGIEKKPAAQLTNGAVCAWGCLPAHPVLTSAAVGAWGCLPAHPIMHAFPVN